MSLSLLRRASPELIFGITQSATSAAIHSTMTPTTNMKKRTDPTVKKLSSIRLAPAELAALRDLSAKLGMTYRGRSSAAAILHHVASGEALVLMIALDTSDAMRDVASRLPPIAETFDDNICELLKAISSALWTAADLKQQFEQSEADDIKDDYRNS